MEEIADKLFLKSKKLVRLYVGLSGIPGSGKTTFAKKLATYIHETYNVKTIHISMDGFHLPKEELKRFSDPTEAFNRRGSPKTFNPSLLLKLIKNLKCQRPTETICFPSFDHKIGDPVFGDIEVSFDTRILIFEGLYLSFNENVWRDIYNEMDESFFLECTLELARKRLVNRHIEAGLAASEEEAQHRINSNDFKNADLMLKNRLKCISINL